MKNLLLVIAILTLESYAFAQDVVVLVHENNPITSISRALLKNYILKKETLWSSGEKIVAVVPSVQSKGYAIFLREVLAMDKATYDRYLIEMKFRSGLAPAREFDEGFIPNVVGVALGGLGVMNRSAWKPSPEYKVKEVKITE